MAAMVPSTVVGVELAVSAYTNLPTPLEYTSSVAGPMLVTGWGWAALPRLRLMKIVPVQ